MSKHAFPKDKRLLKPGDYSHVFKRPVRSGDAWLTVLAATSTTDQARMGLAVSRKALPRAVQRNRVKRLARESFRLNHPQLEAIDMVILAKRDAAKASNAQLQKSLAGHWRRIQKRWRAAQSELPASSSDAANPDNKTNG